MVVDPERLELPTPAFEAQCSIQLSYGSGLHKTAENVKYGAPGEIRTPDLTVRSRSLYPTELRALNYCGWIIAGCGEIITHNCVNVSSPDWWESRLASTLAEASRDEKFSPFEQ